MTFTATGPMPDQAVDAAIDLFIILQGDSTDVKPQVNASDDSGSDQSQPESEVG